MKIFASVLGQVDNVGDTVLRRAFLEALRPAGELQLFVGERDDSYLGALGLTDADTVFRSSASWRREVSRTSLREASVYAFNAGEIEVRRSYAGQYLRLAPLLLASRLRGGHAVHAGFGIRRPSWWRVPIGVTLHMCDIVSWRDHESRAAMGLGRVAPDWAFAVGSPDAHLTTGWSDADRGLLAVSMRYNGPRPDATWTRSVRRLADQHGLEIVTVAQILRDGPLAAELAAELGGTAVVWKGPDHAGQEARLRETYRHTRLLVTNRLHAAVMGLTEGALPLALTQAGSVQGSVQGTVASSVQGTVAGSGKVPRSLAAAGILGVSVDAGLADFPALARTARDVLSRREPILQHVVDARADLRTLGEDIRRLAV
ncbi:hypothetical protein [Glaciibacter sp. 2TAF33]|uniref:hypothetical protein n=1 Tax=Glaciibacter sp. 2TAF33 TaxID=3233015 RepID=UPI003F8F7F32